MLLASSRFLEVSFMLLGHSRHRCGVSMLFPCCWLIVGIGRSMVLIRHFLLINWSGLSFMSVVIPPANHLLVNKLQLSQMCFCGQVLNLA